MRVKYIKVNGNIGVLVNARSPLAEEIIEEFIEAQEEQGIEVGDVLEASGEELKVIIEEFSEAGIDLVKDLKLEEY